MTDFAREDDIRHILATTRTIAVVGLSQKPHRPSHGVSSYLQSHGYRIIPVNPTYREVLGEKCYPRLADLPERPETVNVFRKPQFVAPLVDEVIAAGIPNLWLQEGVIDEAAARKARAAGVRVVMNRCMLKEHRRFGGGQPGGAPHS